MSRPIDLYIVPPSSACQAVITAARYLNIDVNLIVLDTSKDEQKEDWFVKLNPQHCLPTINDNGFVLWESRAILTYLANQYAPGHSIYPTEVNARATVDRLLQFDLNVLNRVMVECLMPVIKDNKDMSNLNPVAEKKVKEALSYLESILVAHLYVADDLKYEFSSYANISQWYKRLEALIINVRGSEELNYHHYAKSVHDLHTD